MLSTTHNIYLFINAYIIHTNTSELEGLQQSILEPSSLPGAWMWDPFFPSSRLY